jgi:hypothetical protein
MSSKIIPQFLSNENYVHIVSIFEKFLVNKHSLNEKSLKKLDLRTIFQETMLRIKKDVNLKNKSTLDLNKITLSIVKNVIKEKIINPDINKQVSTGTNSKSALQRDMDVNTIPIAPITSNSRPMISKDYVKGEEYDVFKQYENVLKNRTIDIKTTKNTSSLKESSSKEISEIDTAMTNEEFMKKLNHMNSLRKNNELLSNFLPEKSPLKISPIIQQIPERVNTPTKTTITLDQLDQLKEHIQNKTKPSQSLVDFLNIPIDKKIDNDSKNHTVQKKKKDVKIKESVVRYLLIDSYDRNMKNYGNKYDYVIHFETPIENIVSVKLVQAIYSQINNETNSGVEQNKAYYVNLMIEEFEETSSNYCNNYTTGRAFTQLPVQNIDHIYDTNSQTKHFKTPIKSLKKVSIRILNRDGSPYTNSIIGEHFFKFELKLNETDKYSNTSLSLNIDDIYDETSSESTSYSSTYLEDAAHVDEKVEVHVDEKVEVDVDLKVEVDVDLKVEVHVDEKVEVDVDLKVDENVGENVDEKVDKKVDKKVDVDLKVDEEVDLKVDENVDEEVDLKVDEKVDKKVDENVDEKVDKKVDENVDEKVDKKVDEKVEVHVDLKVDVVKEEVDVDLKVDVVKEEVDVDLKVLLMNF